MQLEKEGRTGAAFPTSYSARVAAIAADGQLNQVKRGLFSAMMDMAGPARGWLLRNVITGPNGPSDGFGELILA